MFMENMINPKTPLLQVSLEDFWEMGLNMGVFGVGNLQHDVSKGRKPWIVAGIKSLAKELCISPSTVNRMLAEGVIDSATFQFGKTILFDVDAVLDLLRRDRK